MNIPNLTKQFRKVGSYWTDINKNFTQVMFINANLKHF